MPEWEFKDEKEADNNGIIFISFKKNPWIQTFKNLNESQSTINEKTILCSYNKTKENESKDKFLKVNITIHYVGSTDWCVWSLWKSVWRFFQKLEREPPYDRTISFFGMSPKDMNDILLLRYLLSQVYFCAIHNI